MQKYSLLIALAASLVGSSQADPCYRSEEHFIGGRCYQLVSRQLSFEDARYWCHYQNPSTSSYLATVPDQKTANFLASYALTTFGNDNNFWIGLSRNTASSGYRWDSGYPLGWTNFNVQNGGLYVAESAKNAKWSTFGADAKFNFVCSYDPYAPGTTNYPTQDPTETTSTETTTTSSAPSPCTPSDSFVILYAYSNDLDFNTVNETLFQIIGNNGFRPRWSKMANIRFDVVDQEPIQFHDTLQSFKSSVLSRMPDPSLGFKSSSAGSDVLNVIRKLLATTVTSPCGAKALFLLKRYSNEQDVSGLIADIQHYQIFVQTLAANHTSGGLNHQAMYDVSSGSNGLYVTNDDSVDFHFWINAWLINGDNFLFLNYKQNLQVRGYRGSWELKQFYVPSRFNSDDVFCRINIQKDGMNMQQLNDYTLKFTDRNGIVQYQTNQTLTGKWWSMQSTMSGGHLGMSSEVTSYRVWLDYEYSVDVVKDWEIRCFVRSPPSVWPTF